MSDAAPLWICFLPQFASVLGDSFGQRCSRVYHHGNRRRFIIGMLFVSSLQMLVVLSIIQLALPNTTRIIYEKVNGTNVDFCAQPENADDDRCYAQGPLTIYRALDLCPLLLLNGLLNIIYYVGEATMYRQSLGVLMLVLAALASSFIIAPLQEWFDLDGAKQVNVWSIVLGIFGAVCCLVERTPPASADETGQLVPATTTVAVDDEDNGSISSATSLKVQGFPPTSGDTFGADTNTIDRQRGIQDDGSAQTETSSLCTKGLCHRLLKHLPLLAPFLLLSLAYGLYFVIMLLYNDRCKINMWGYNAYDQVTFPIYMFAVFFMVDVIGPCRRTIRWDDPQDASVVASCRICFHELTANRCAGLANMFVYRLLINARAIAYTYITVTYNLSSSYLELTLIRVVLSWVASVVLVLVVPRFIDSEEKEQRKLRDWVNLLLKIIGTVAIVGSLLIIHYGT